eukprot:IDg7001t1
MFVVMPLRCWCILPINHLCSVLHDFMHGAQQYGGRLQGTVYGYPLLHIELLRPPSFRCTMPIWNHCHFPSLHQIQMPIISDILVAHISPCVLWLCDCFGIASESIDGGSIGGRFSLSFILHRCNSSLSVWGQDCCRQSETTVPEPSRPQESRTIRNDWFPNQRLANSLARPAALIVTNAKSTSVSQSSSAYQQFPHACSKALIYYSTSARSGPQFAKAGALIRGCDIGTAMQTRTNAQDVMCSRYRGRISAALVSTVTCDRRTSSMRLRSAPSGSSPARFHPSSQLCLMTSLFGARAPSKIDAIFLIFAPGPLSALVASSFMNAARADAKLLSSPFELELVRSPRSMVGALADAEGCAGLGAWGRGCDLKVCISDPRKKQLSVVSTHQLYSNYETETVSQQLPTELRSLHHSVLPIAESFRIVIHRTAEACRVPDHAAQVEAAAVEAVVAPAAAAAVAAVEAAAVVAPVVAAAAAAAAATTALGIATTRQEAATLRQDRHTTTPTLTAATTTPTIMGVPALSTSHLFAKRLNLITLKWCDGPLRQCRERCEQGMKIE